ncbi:MAG: FecR domain-containing protein [Pseudobacter sp.]|uniref:FecR domain-containing protein n=1 Tax=Pseudobacter sp. TaxID=2045420 RepID=UPI003F812217
MIDKNEILSRYARRQVSPEEQQAFQEWMQTLDQQELDVLIDDYAAIVAALPDLEESADTRLLLSIHQEIAMKEFEEAGPTVPRIPFWRSWRAAAAAIIVLTLSVTAFFWLRNYPQQLAEEKTTPAKEIAPGKSGAILTLADGSQMVLDSANNGILAKQNGSVISMQNGQLVYGSSAEGAKGIEYNTMSTPRGRQFEITLPDGTHVWLNAASSIRYPTAFQGKDRKVELEGEAYFEVAKNANQPFIVNALNKATIEVLGTSFNVNAYKNENSLNTTLINGSIKVNGTIIKPGQQARVTDALRITSNADLDQVMAWQRGYFNFDGASLKEVIQQLERWYEIEVVYEKGIPDIRFGGEMMRDMTLNGVLIALEKSGMRYRLEGRKLFVLPK